MTSVADARVGVAALVLAALAIAGLTTGCARADPEVGVVLDGTTMGTTYRVRVDDPGAELEREAIASLVQETLDDVDAKMSTWQPDSEVSRLNRLGAEKAMVVSPATFEVLRAAIRLSEETAGAFDVTVGPLVDLWGFGPGGSPGRVPEPDEIAALQPFVGAELLALDPESRTVSKSLAGVRVDLSAIAKGHAVDRVLERLAEAGWERLMVEVGGEVRTLGRSGEDRPWRIGIESPVAGSRHLAHRIELVDAALASSGNYRNFIEIAGKRYGHEIDPRTGHPVEHGLLGVSVVAATCMEADALATTLMVMGPDEGFVWAREAEIAALFFVQEEGEIAARPTPGFERLTDAEL